MNIEQRIKELEEWANAYNKTGTLPSLDCGIKALEVINHLQSELKFKNHSLKGCEAQCKFLLEELERYKSLWEANAAESEEIIAEPKAKDEWQDISSAPHFEQVLVFYKNYFNNPRIVIARYLPEGTECECSNDCGCEYDDEKEIYVQEGWYEKIDNWGDDSEVAISEGEPTHWRHLPKPPKQNH